MSVRGNVSLSIDEKATSGLLDACISISVSVVNYPWGRLPCIEQYSGVMVASMCMKQMTGEFDTMTSEVKKFDLAGRAQNLHLSNIRFVD